MKIEKVMGTHSARDEIILVTSNREAITLEDVFHLVKTFAKNELRRIRVDFVRNEIIDNQRPFLFENEIKKAIQEAKDEEYYKGGGL